MSKAFPNAPLLHRLDTTGLRRDLDASGWTYAEIALMAGVTKRTIELYLAPDAAQRGRKIPYPLQFTLEAIARCPRQSPRRRNGKK